MRLDDQFRLSIANLWRTKLRTTLTTMGVIIGIGALSSMISFGTGMQKNVTEAFKENDLFTSLYVTPQKIDLEQVVSGDVEGIVGSLIKPAPTLNDSALQKIQNLAEVEIAFPEIRFPVKARLDNNITRTTLRAIPSAMGRFKPFNQLPFGRFFTDDTSCSVLLSQRILKELKFIIQESSHPIKLSLEDSLRGLRSVSPDSILGKEIQIITSVVDVAELNQNPLQYLTSPVQTPFREQITTLKIIGVQKKSRGFEEGRLESGIIVPLKIVEKIPHLGFSSVRDLLGRMGRSDGYNSIYVRVKKIKNMESIRQEIENMGFGVISITDQIQEIKKGFLILDTLLGAIGTIALIVAALGIINTMVMSILERTREIGIMMAIGGSETEIKRIFLIEASVIGFIGGIFGLILGWIVSRIANIVANYYIAKEGGYYIDLFYFPPWLILGALMFSIVVSLLAGLYPAVRASRVDPVQALRHD